MIYILEFFTDEVDGESRPPLRVKHRAKTAALAEKHARAQFQSVLIGDKKADGCLIKDQLGKLVSEVRANDRRKGNEAG